MTRALALGAIGVYQRYVSPYKGFCCAYRVHQGGASCSALGARVIRRFGVFQGLSLLRERLQRCGEAYRQAHRAPALHRTRQQGFVDLDCGDAGGCTELGDCLDVSDCACECCDWPGKERKPTQKDRRRRDVAQRPPPTPTWPPE